MRLKDPVEILFLGLLLRWENTAPPDKTQGFLDDNPERNTQMSRMAYVLNKVGTGVEDKYFLKLSVGASWSKLSGTFLDKNNDHMENPYPLNASWWLDGCASLERKLEMMQDLTKLGISPTFTRCACDFIAGESVASYMPTEEEQDEIVRKIREEEGQLYTLQTHCFELVLSM